jgi:hypothetical protein
MMMKTVLFVFALIASASAEANPDCLKSCNDYKEFLLKDYCLEAYHPQSRSQVFCDGLKGEVKSACVRAGGSPVVDCGMEKSCPSFANCEATNCRKSC